MPPTRFACVECGLELAEADRVCPACGAEQWTMPARREEPEEVDHRPGAERVDDAPRSAAASLALTTLGICALFALAVAVLSPGSSLTGAIGQHTGVGTEWLRDIPGLAMTQARVPGIDSAGLAFLPMSMALVPVGAAWFAAQRRLGRVANTSLADRLRWAVGGAVLFGVLEVLIAITADHHHGDGVRMRPATAFLGATLLAFAGAAIGVIRTASGPERANLFDADGWRRVRTLVAPLRALGALLLVAGAVCLVHEQVQTLRGQTTATYGRERGGAFVENLLYVADDAVSGAGYAVLANAVGGPSALPPSDGKLDGYLDNLDQSSGQGRITALRGSIASFAYYLELALLVGSAVCAAIAAGTLAARAAGVASPAMRVVAGAVAGPVWAFALAALRVLASAELVGSSLVLWALVFGGVGGAVGGLLATPAARRE